MEATLTPSGGQGLGKLKSEILKAVPPESWLFIVLSQDATGCPKDLSIYVKFLKNIGLIAKRSTPRCLVDNLQRSLS